jgi:lysophospholipase L1-like esterase
VRGLVALGDSITLGEGGSVLGVTCLSWAQWLARALDLPYTCYARNGAVARDVVAGQLPRVRPGHDLGCLYVGVNDVRGPGFDPAAYERDLLATAEGLRARCDRLLLCTIPLDLGRPPAAPKPAVAGAAIRRVAAATDAAVCDLDDLAGRVLLWPDAGHPTAVGQLEIADRAARALRSAVLPSSLADVPHGRVASLRHGPAYLRVAIRERIRRH